MTASTKGILLTKADRIKSRIDELEHYFLNLDVIRADEKISKEHFKEFMRSVRLIVTTEMTEKGVERSWKE